MRTHSRTFTDSLKMLHLQAFALFLFISCSFAQTNLNAVPAIPVQTQGQLCQLDLSAELFGGVSEACGRGRNLDRTRCCPVLAAWLYAAHARYALKAPAPSSSLEGEMPMMPDDSQKCVNSLMDALASKNITIPRPNKTCDPILCFCGIRLHETSSLRCPVGFNVSSGHHNATASTSLRNLEKSCQNSSYSGCTTCLGALQKLKGGDDDDSKNRTRDGIKSSSADRANKMLNRDCQLMGLTWLLTRNKTTYIPTVSAVLRAIMYSDHTSNTSKCSPDQENMPLAVDSLELERAHSASPSFVPPLSILLIMILSPFV